MGRDRMSPGHRRRLVGGLLSLAAVAVFSAPIASQDGERTVWVSVLDEDGAPVDGLGSGDFVVEEDGEAREVLRVGPASTAMQVAVLVDISSAAQSVIPDIRGGLASLVTKLHQDHEIALVAFGQRPQILVESTRQLERLENGIGRIFAFPSSAAYLLDALVETARGFERRESSRPVIVVVATDGIDYSNRDARQTLDALDEAGVATHVLLLRDNANLGLRNDPALADTLRERDMALSQGPDRTGGRRRDLLMGRAFTSALRELAVMLSSQYEVVYSRPARLIPPDEITVRMRQDELTAYGAPAKHTGD